MHPEDSKAIVPVAYGDAALPAAPSEPEGHNLWAVLDSRLRGRWIMAGVVGAFLAVGLGAGAYVLTKPKYESVGLIHIKPYLTPIMTQTPETGLLPMYHNYVQTQVSLIRSRPVIELAVRDPVMANVPWARESGALRRIERDLGVDVMRGSELIEVTFRSDLAGEAQAVVNAVINAYEAEHISGANDEIGQTLNTLYVGRTQLRERLEEKKHQIEQHLEGSRYAAGDQAALISDQNQRIWAIEQEIEKYQLDLEAAKAALQTGGGPAGPLSADLVRIDPRIASLRGARDAAAARVDELVRKGHLERSRPYQLARDELFRAEEALAAAVDDALEEWRRAAAGAGPEDLSELGPVTVELIEAELRRLERQRKKHLDEIQKITTDAEHLAEIRAEQEALEKDLAGMQARIASLEMEGVQAREKRIRVVDRGNRPTAPSKDRRRKLAFLGFAGGLAASFGFFFLLGTVDRRAYSTTQIRNERTGRRCLGVLPDLERGRLDPEACAVAAHCVHQIRNQVELLRDANRSMVLAVTSPYQGDGKTSIVMALGWSYAAAGNRTLIVDCDLVGQGLTRQTGKTGLGGLREALREGRADGHTVPAGTANLTIMPAGRDALFGSEFVRRGDLEALFEDLRQNYDVIIVDTGPMGSLEELPVAAAADGVLLSLRRGRRQPRLEECVEALRHAGARYLGIVLNCAVRSDCERYVSKSTISPLAVQANGLPGFGRGAAAALVQAMEAARRPGREGESERAGVVTTLHHRDTEDTEGHGGSGQARS